MTDPGPHIPIHPARVGIRSITVHLYLLVLSAVMLALAFPRPGWWPLAFVALVPATFLAMRSRRPWRLTWTAWLVFTLWWLIMARWLIPVTRGGYVALGMLQAGYFTLALLLLHEFHRRYRAPMILALPLVWVAVEYVRCRFPAGGFGWFALGHSQAAWHPGHGAPWLVQIADLFGQHGVSFLVAMTNGLLIDLATQPVFIRLGAGRRRLRRPLRGALLLWAIAFAASLIYGWYRVQQHDDVTRPGPTLAVIQTDVPQSNKLHRTAEQDERDFQRMVALTRQAAADPAAPSVIVWPETMVPAALNDEAQRFYETTDTGWAGLADYAPRVESLAASLGVSLLAGASGQFDWQVYDLPNGRQAVLPARRTNSVYAYDPAGVRLPTRYDKMHRVPFGEYLPWIDAVPALKDLFLKYISPYPYDYTLTPGARPTVFDLPVPRSSASHASITDARPVDTNPDPVADAAPLDALAVVTPICYDDVVPSVVRALVFTADGGKRADVIVNVTNSAWFRGVDQRWQHVQIASLRSIENRVPTARSVNSGVSGFIDSVGRIGPIVPPGPIGDDVSGYATATVRLDDRVPLFGRVGEWPIVALTVLAALLAAFGLLRADKIKR